MANYSASDLNALNAAFSRTLTENGMNGALFPSVFTDALGTSLDTVLSLTVSSTGSDAVGAANFPNAPFATVQGALNALPKHISSAVTITVGAGNFAGFNVDGFTFDYNALGSYLLIQGTMAAVTPATGSATGTASAGATQSGTTFATLTDAAALWTVNNFVGKYVQLTGGLGATLAGAVNYNTYYPIVSNTGTVITIAGNWGSAGAPNGTTTYAIVDQATFITSAAPLNTVSGFGASDSYVRIMNCSGSMSTIRQQLEIKAFGSSSAAKINFSFLSPSILPTITACSLDTTTSTPITIFDGAHAQVRNCQIGGAGQTSGALVNIGSSTGLAGNVSVADSFLRAGVTTAGPHVAVLGTAHLGLLRCRFEGGTTSTSGVINFRDNAACGYMNQCQIDGNSLARVGIFAGVGSNSAASGASGPVGFTVLTTKFANCLTAVVANGPLTLLEMRTGVVFDTCTNGINVSRGARVQYGSTNSVATVTNEIIVDGAAAALVTDLRAATPKVLKDSDYFTAIYE